MFFLPIQNGGAGADLDGVNLAGDLGWDASLEDLGLGDLAARGGADGEVVRLARDQAGDDAARLS